MIDSIQEQKQKITEGLRPVHHCGLFLRCQQAPLVWYRNHKAASTLYNEFFQRLGWRHCDAADVDWDKDQVFGHLRAPDVKYLKGVATAFQSRNLSRIQLLALIMQHPHSHHFLTEMQGFDLHTQTIQYHLDDEAKRTYWIPVDSPYVDHKLHTLELLQSVGQTVSDQDRSWLLDAPDMNRSSSAESELYHHLRSSPLPPNTRRYLLFDRNLYDIVVEWYQQKFEIKSGSINA